MAGLAGCPFGQLWPSKERDALINGVSETTVAKWFEQGRKDLADIVKHQEEELTKTVDQRVKYERAIQRAVALSVERLFSFWTTLTTSFPHPS